MKKVPAKASIPKYCVSIEEAAARIGIGRSLMYSDLLKKNRIRSIKIGSRKVIPEKEIAAFIDREMATNEQA